MTRQRGDNGRYVENPLGSRKATKSFRITPACDEKLNQVLQERGLSLADLVELWVENGCPTSSSTSDHPNLEQLKKQVLEEFRRSEKVGLQSSIYKKVEKIVTQLINALSSFQV